MTAPNKLVVDGAGNLQVISAAGSVVGLTDAELRATPVPVSGTVNVVEPVTVDGTVALDAASLAALETISVANFPATQVVSANDLDIRNLVPTQDAVRVGYQRDPAWTGVYVYVHGPAGAAAATNHLSLFNPAASGKTLVLLSVEVESFSAAVATADPSLRLTRVSAASAGTADSAGIVKFDTSDPAATGVVRHTNPTVTSVNDITFFSPNQNLTVAGTTAVSRRIWRPDPSWGEFRLAEGQGVVLKHGAATDVDQRWALTIVWAER